MEGLTWKSNGGTTPELSLGRDSFKVTTKPKCDFWCTPSFKKIDGQFGYLQVEGDFKASVSFKGKYQSQYDQAGLMIYISEDHWIKAGIEFINEVLHISAVVTKPYSDWSIVPIKGFTKDTFKNEVVHLSVEKKGRQLLVDYFLDSQAQAISDDNWTMLRKVNGFFPEKEEGNVEVGLMAASPQSITGFEVDFFSFHLEK